MNDDEYLAKVTEGRRQSVEYFSSSNKEERERWVVLEFLRLAAVPHQESDVCSSTDDPPDVRALGAEFEIT